MTTEQKLARNAWQREHRRKNKDADTRIYEKTKKGFLMRMYRNMESRIKGVQKQKFHLYQGKELLPRNDFYTWALLNENFHFLFDVYEKSGYDIKLAPSADRIDPDHGYILGNIQFVTHSENSRRTTRNGYCKKAA